MSEQPPQDLAGWMHLLFGEASSRATIGVYQHTFRCAGSIWPHLAAARLQEREQLTAAMATPDQPYGPGSPHFRYGADWRETWQHPPAEDYLYERSAGGEWEAPL